MIFSHCHYCGAGYGAGSDTFPKKCSTCGHVHYRNPIPVAVGMVPCEDGLLGILRGIDPKKGHLALPGGFVDMETPEAGCSRELHEETGIILAASVWSYASSFLTPHGNLLMFFEARVDPIALPSFPYLLPEGAIAETEGFEVIRPGARLAFPSHEDAAQAFLARLAGQRLKPNGS
jgi:8-oxo-dGTP pyrophosphatase MutT (NUDIX family)